mgnify:CR=1 FL=1
MNKKVSAVLIAVALTAAGHVSAAELNAYSIMPEKYASRIFAEFTKDTGIKVNFLRFSSGEALARLTAERGNPQVDVSLPPEGFRRDSRKPPRPRKLLDRYRRHSSVFSHQHQVSCQKQHEGPVQMGGPPRSPL